MNWICKKQLAKRKQKIVRDIKTKHNIGKTIVQLTFNDGKIFATTVYGEVNQFLSWGHDESQCGNKVEEPKIYPLYVNSSLNNAQEWLIRIQNDEKTYQNGTKNVTEIYVGKVLSAKILDTVDYEEEFMEARLVPNDE